MKIIQLTAENIKRLVAVEITPTSNIVEITGDNAQGKTSILDAIWWALDTNKIIQSKPIRDGEKYGFVELDLGDYIVTKTFRLKEDGEVAISLTVKNADGAKFGSPQDLLKSFIGDLTFDPLEFSRMETKKQVVALRKLVPEFDFAASDLRKKTAFDSRTDVNRDIKSLKAQLQGMVQPTGDEEEADTSALIEELTEALSNNSFADAAEAKARLADQRIEEKTQDIAGLRRQIKNLENQIAEAEASIENIKAEKKLSKSNIKKVDVEDIRARVTAAEEQNRAFGRREDYEALQKSIADKEAAAEALTKTIEDERKLSAKAVQKAKLPVKGLSLTEDEVLLNGQPLDQASDAEQLRLSIAVAGAMNPKLRVIRVRDGSLLGTKAMDAVEEYAKANDYQIWIETVESGRETAILIEDGRVANKEQTEAVL